MENVFGWPMGPAYLLDVVGIDTAYHCTGVMADGFPERMARQDKDPVTVFANENVLVRKMALVSTNMHLTVAVVLKNRKMQQQLSY